jgi:integrase
LQLLLVTGARLNEVAGMRRDELAAGGLWTIPGSRAKNHRQHVVPLPPLAQAILAGVPAVESTDLVFTLSGRLLTGFSRVKAALAAHMGAVPPWRIHDLRRTCATGMQALKVRTEVIERCLNHLCGSYRGVAGIYQRDALSDEVAAAFALWAAHVHQVVTS